MGEPGRWVLRGACVALLVAGLGCQPSMPREPAADPDAGDPPVGEGLDGGDEGSGIGGPTFGPLQPDPFVDAAPVDAARPDAAPCDDAVGDHAVCDELLAGAGAAETCLTAALCEAYLATLTPRAAGVAMNCLAATEGECWPELAAECLLVGSLATCQPAEEGAPACDALAEPCASGDLWGTVGLCLAVAGALQPEAVAELSGCLEEHPVCDPSALQACAATSLL